MKQRIVTCIHFIIFVFLGSLFPFPMQAQEHPSFVTIVHPVRGRPMWSDISRLSEQASFSQKRNLPATWLVQYNVLGDHDVVTALQSYTGDEIGIFLEVSEELATDAKVPYVLGFGDWAKAHKVFFSGYEIDERKRMLDVVFEKFKDTFGYYPKSVGAWYIDAVTLEYITKKYGVIAAIDCADQYATDGYEKWGKPWSVPYYVSRWNTLVPAQSEREKLPVVKIQWALRDPNLGYGPSIPDSTYSLQANDYVGHHKLGIDYFSYLLDIYLHTKNAFSQATVGIEVGTESQFLDELDRQIAEVAKRRDVGTRVVTMSEFALWYQSQFPNVSPDHVIYSETAIWYNSPYYRIGLLLENGTLYIRDTRLYDENYLEIDSVAKDNHILLYRSIYGDIDDVLYNNKKILAENISAFLVQRNGDNNVVISWQGENPGTLVLDKTKATINKNIVFDGTQSVKLGLFRTFWHTLSRMSAQFARIPKPRYYPAPIRFATIGTKQVFGLQTKSNQLFAISFPPFRIGFSYFPYQSLAWFRTWPKINIPKLFFSSSSALIADWYKETHGQNLQIISREELSSDRVANLEKSGWTRVFENSVTSFWQQNKKND